MSIKDYSEEDNYYSQGFEKCGVVSIWVGHLDDTGDPESLYVLQDLCGVGYYDPSLQEGNCFNYKKVPLINLLDDMSYSASFIEQAMVAAKERGFASALWVMLQYDFEYNQRESLGKY